MLDCFYLGELQQEVLSIKHFLSDILVNVCAPIYGENSKFRQQVIILNCL